MEEGLLCKSVHEYFCDPETFQLTEHWLAARDCLQADYAMDLVLNGSSMDELFILLVAMVTRATISIAHMGGLDYEKRQSTRCR